MLSGEFLDRMERLMDGRDPSIQNANFLEAFLDDHYPDDGLVQELVSALALYTPGGGPYLLGREEIARQARPVLGHLLRGYVLAAAPSGDGELSILSENGKFLLIEDQQDHHLFVLSLLKHRRPIYASFSDLLTHDPVPAEMYEDYERRYGQYWARQKSRYTLFVEKRTAPFPCAALIHQFEPSLSPASIREQLLHGTFQLEVSCWEAPERARALSRLVACLLSAGAEVEWYHLGKKCPLPIQPE